MLSQGSTTTARLRFSGATLSGETWFHQSISPVASAFCTVEGSGMMRHSTRSTETRFGPAQKLGAPSGRGT